MLAAAFGLLPAVFVFPPAFVGVIATLIPAVQQPLRLPQQSIRLFGARRRDGRCKRTRDGKNDRAPPDQSHPNVPSTKSV